MWEQSRRAFLIIEGVKYMQDWQREFEFDPTSAERIVDTVYKHPLSLQYCAEIVELAGKLSDYMSVQGVIAKLKALLKEREEEVV